MKLISFHSFKSCVEAFHSIFLKAVIQKKYVLKCESLLVLEFSIYAFLLKLEEHCLVRTL